MLFRSADLCVRPPKTSPVSGEHMAKGPPIVAGGVQSRAMKDVSLPARHALRLRGYDYSTPGAYFVTLCAAGRRCDFGTVQDGIVTLTTLGHIIHNTWVETCSFCAGVNADVFVVMPNHLHAIVLLHNDTTAREDGRNGTTELSSLIRRFKTLSTSRAVRAAVSEGRSLPRGRVWQRSYYEHVIRNDYSLERIRDYVGSNPLRWSLDRENPESVDPPVPPSAGAEEQWMV